MLKRHFSLRLLKNLAEELPRFFAAEEVLLVGRFVVGIAGRKHHALDAQLHHFVEELADALRIRAVEQSSVGGDAEAALERQANAFDGFVVGAFAADRKIVVLALAVHVHGERKILTGREFVKAFGQQQRVGAEVDVLLARDQARPRFRQSADASAARRPGC